MPPSQAKPRRLIVISDFCDGEPTHASGRDISAFRQDWADGERGPAPLSRCPDAREREDIVVGGGYLERLPLACIRQGLCDGAEIWTFLGHDGPPPFTRDSNWLARRSFRVEPSPGPRSSPDMLGHIAAFGAPDILCVWGLGVDESIMRACAASFKIYNSIDAPALRIPPEASRHFDLVVTGAEWQSEAVHRRHPGMATLVLPIGPDFAAPDTFFPLGLEAVYDVIYVAAAQAYKRHDILFDALARMPRTTRALCVCGYGELGQALREQAAARGLAVDFVGPPGVGFAEVNRLMNLARVGVVCGIDDGAPAILTEYMLAGLPVLANAELRCGLQYITPQTGMAACAQGFHLGLAEILARRAGFTPRETAIARWSWPRSVATLAAAIDRVQCKKNLGARRNRAAREQFGAVD